MRGSGLRMPTSLESMTTSNSSSRGTMVRQYSRNSTTLLVISPVR